VIWTHSIHREHEADAKPPGILQGPATGLAMSELVLDGRVSCCDVSELTA
jgi:hypothetical protein